MRHATEPLLVMVLAGLLATYLTMAVTAMRSISLDEYALYTSSIVCVVVGHAGEAGGVRALDYAHMSRAEPALTAHMSVAGA